MKSFNFSRPIALAATLTTGITALHGQVVFIGTSYDQNFNGIGGGLPTGCSVTTFTSANADLTQIPPTLTSLGTARTFQTATTQWEANGINDVFANAASPKAFYASPGFVPANGNITPSVQGDATDRAVGVNYRPRDAGGFANALQFQISSSQPFRDLGLTFDFLNMRQNTGAGAKVDVALYAAVGTVSAANPLRQISVSEVPDYRGWQAAATQDLSRFNGQSGTLTLEFLVFGPAAAGDSMRAGMDNVHFAFDAVPEPEHLALAVGLGLVGWGIWRRRS